MPSKTGALLGRVGALTLALAATATAAAAESVESGLGSSAQRVITVPLTSREPVTVAGIAMTRSRGRLAVPGSHFRLRSALGPWTSCGRGAEGSGWWATWKNGLSVKLEGPPGAGCGPAAAVVIATLDAYGPNRRARDWTVKTELGTLRVGKAVADLPRKLRARADTAGAAGYLEWSSSNACVRRALKGYPRMNVQVASGKIIAVNVYAGWYRAPTC